MPKHAFKFPREVIEAVKAHVERAVRSIDPHRFEQEPAYTNTLITRLEGTAYDGEHGFVRFELTSINDRGPHSAEWQYGGDFAITAVISDGRTRIEKGILVQAKFGTVKTMPPSQLAALKGQIQKMRAIVKAPKVMEIPIADTFRDPHIISGLRIIGGESFQSARLADYMATRVTTTLDGVTVPHVVAALKQSSLSKLNVTATLDGCPS